MSSVGPDIMHFIFPPCQNSEVGWEEIQSREYGVFRFQGEDED